MSTVNNPVPPAQATTISTVDSNVLAALGVADASSVQRVQGLGLVHQARLAQLTRTAVDVTAQYGAGSTQAAAAEASVAASKATVARLAVVNLQVTIAKPQVSATGWAIYGHVYNAQLQPLAAYTVFLADDQKTYQRAYGFAYTASDGSFQINYAGSPTGAAATPQLYLEIANNNGLPVYLSTTAFQPQLGVATYQDITLPAGEPIIGDPPAGIRPIALPDPIKVPIKDPTKR
jgi:hypothetical protein